MTQTSESATNKSVKREVSDTLRNDFLGADEWKSSKLGYLSGYAPLKKSVSTAYRSNVELAKFAGSGLRALFSRSQSVALNTIAKDPEERFLVAMQAHRISEDGLPKVEKSSRIHAFAYLFVTLLLTAWSLYLMSGALERQAGLISYIFPFVAHLFVVPMTIRYCFWNWQLRNRSLRSVGDFASRPTEWIPPVTGSSIFIWGVIFILGLVVLGPNEATAAPINELLGFVSHENDIFHGTLFNMLGGFPPFDATASGAEASPWVAPLAEAFRAFNTALLAVGGAMLGWHTISGMVSTAQEGEVLGKRWNTLWAPVRVTVGVGALVPMASGLNAVQVLVLYIVLAGSHLANTVWYAYVDAYSSLVYITEEDRQARATLLSKQLHDISVDERGGAFVIDTFESLVCLNGMSEAAKIYISSAGINSGSEFSDISAMSSADLQSAFGEASSPSNLVADNGLDFEAVTATGPKVTLAEVMQGEVDYQVGIKASGASDEYFTLSEVEAAYGENSGVVTRSTPTAFWNFGDICGHSKIQYNTIAEIDGFLRSKGADDSVVSQGRSLAFTSINNMADEVNASVMRPIAEAAQRLSEIAVNPGSYSGEEGYKAKLNEIDGFVSAKLIEAYRSYINVSSARRAELESSLFGLVGGTAAEQMLERAKELGWSSSGSFYVMLAKTNEYNLTFAGLETYASGSDFDEISETSGLFGWSDKYREDVVDIFQGESGIAATLREYMDQQAAKVAASVATEDLVAAVNEDVEGNWFKWILGIAGQALAPLYSGLWGLGDVSLDSGRQALEPDPYNALIHMIDMGHYILGVATVLLISGLVLFIAAKGFEVSIFGKAAGMFGAGGVMSAVSEIATNALKTIGFLLMAVGIVHAFVVPSLPYIFMLFFVTGMLVLVAEALVAAPIWSLLHVRLDGQEFIDSVQKPGYMIAFNLFLRPVLAVFGVALSLIVFSASIYFMNATFSILVEAVTGGRVGLAWIIGPLSMLIIQTFLHYQLAMRSFSLITQVPDRVVRWFGQGGENLNEENDSKSAVMLLNQQSERRVGETAGMLAVTRSDPNVGGDVAKEIGNAGLGGGGSSGGGSGGGKKSGRGGV